MLLDDETRWLGGRVPVLNAAQIAIVADALDAYRAAPAGTSADDFARFMAKLAVSYPAQRVTPDEADLRIEVYGEQLRDIPIDMLDAARKAATQRIKFFPTIAEIRELAYALPRPPRIQRQRRLALLVEAHEARSALTAPADTVDPGEVARLLGRLDIAVERQEPRKRTTPVGRSAPARPAPTVADYVALGITEDEAREMVELQARAA